MVGGKVLFAFHRRYLCMAKAGEAWCRQNGVKSTKNRFLSDFVLFTLVNFTTSKLVAGGLARSESVAPSVKGAPEGATHFVRAACPLTIIPMYFQITPVMLEQR